MPLEDEAKAPQEGYGTEQAPLYDDIIASDAVPPSKYLQMRGNYLPKTRNIPFKVYKDRDYAAQELEHVWKKSWQFACREEEIPEVGDRVPYDVGPLSFMIVRTAPDTIKAFDNFCLHRGTRLCSGRSRVNTIRCPFHGWEWDTDGDLKNIPAQWDFPELDKSTCSLKEAKVDTWEGCVFINPDLNCGPLSDALGVMPEHFTNFSLKNRFTMLHTSKKVRANWKILFEGFLESYHVIETHPQISGYIGDINSRYDIFDDGKAKIGRFMSPIGVPSPLREDHITERDASITLMESFLGTLTDDSVPMPDYENMEDFGRKDVAEWKRQMLKATLGADCSHLSDAEMLDGIQYEMFPNFSPWLGEGFAVMYQFLPYGDNPNESVFNIRFMMPIPEGAPRPPAAEIVELDFDEFYNSLPEWGAMCEVYDQDMSNLPLMQQGIEGALARDPEATSKLAIYQEQRCAALFEFIEEKIAQGEAAAAAKG